MTPPSRFTRFSVLLLVLVAGIAQVAGTAPPPPPPSFMHDVLPLFMRHGCNAGDCHGAARGKDGFMLSLFGYDPEGDYYRLLEEMPGRRINVAAPAQSLLLQKATGAVPHTGGECFTQDSEAWRIIHDWIAARAPGDPPDTPTIEGIRLDPTVVEFSEPAGQRPTRVFARYSDGTERDVTRWALFLSSNSGVVDIDENGILHPRRSGGAHVFARYSRFTEGAEVIVLPKGDFAWAPPPPANYIDNLVYHKLEKLRIAPSPVATDDRFLRRVSLDLIGVPPTVEERAAFLADPDPDKRSKLVDRLLDRDEFTAVWAAKWSEWLRIRTDTNVERGTAPKAGWRYYHWLREHLADDLPLNELFQKLLTGTGSNLRNPPANFYTMIPQAGALDAGALGQDIAQVTLGIRTQCAECHNHPFDRWTMDDYYGWTSFFTGLQRKKGREAAEMLVSVNVDAPPAEHLLTQEPTPHRFLGGEAPDVTDRDPRQVLALWLTATDNTLFRRNMANRIWDHFFGRGIVDPIDDIRISNPASNEPLLEELGRRLAEDHRFSLRGLVRDICTSTTYQLSARTNETNRDDEEFFSHAVLRRPRADILFDTINHTMAYTPKIRRSAQTKAINLFEGGRNDNYNAYFFATFGQAPRESVCACETTTDSTLAQTLHLINGTTVEWAIKGGQRVPQLMARFPKDPEAVVQGLYLALLGREPTANELTVILSDRPERDDDRSLRAFYDSVCWGLLNSSEFLFIH